MAGARAISRSARPAARTAHVPPAVRHPPAGPEAAGVAERFPNMRRTVYMCDVRQERRVNHIFDMHQPELVFHAAALKHVPMVEINPCEGALTNIIGTITEPIVISIDAPWGQGKTT